MPYGNDAQRQLVLQQHPVAYLQCLGLIARPPQRVTGLQPTAISAAHSLWPIASRLPALQRQQSTCTLRMSSEPLNGRGGQHASPPAAAAPPDPRVAPCRNPGPP